MIVVKGARVASAGEFNGERRDIVVEHDRIADVVAPDSVSRDADVMDASGMLLIPGLVNAHTHAHGNLAKGIADRWPLEVFLSWSPWTIGRTIEHYRVAALIGAAEMVRKGCTAAYDLFGQYPSPSVEGVGVVVEAYLEVGMRAVVAPMMADRSLYQAMPGLIEAMPEDLRSEISAIRYAPWTQSVDACRAIARDWPYPADRAKFALGPTVAHHCTDDFLEGLRNLARDFDLGIHMHIAESKPDVVAGVERYGKTPVAHLDDLGLLGEKFIAAHSVWIDDDDAARFVNNGVSVAHNPMANMKLGSGLAEIRRLLTLGVPVAIGTDGARSSDNQNMFEAMRLACYTSRVVGRDESEWLSAAETFAAATKTGAKLLGWESQIGEIRKGAKADLVFLRLDGMNYVPLNDAIAQLVFCEDGTTVDTVMVDGRVVLRSGSFVGFDVAALARRAESVIEDMRRVNADAKPRAQRLEKHVAAYAHGLMGRSYHISRFSGSRA